MNKYHLLRTLLASACFLGFVSTADAALTYWGARATTSVADCPSSCTNFNSGPTLGGENVLDSGISSISETRGNASARVSLTGTLGTPVLKAESAANPSLKGAFATAFGVQGYTYNGPGETLTLDILLDGLVSDPEMDASDTNAQFEVVLYAPENFFFTTSRGTLEGEANANPLSQPDTSEASITLQLDFTNTMNDSGQLSIDVATGDEFYLWAYLTVDSRSGSLATSVDAFNTGTISFVGNPNLTPVTVVPLPAAVWFLGAGVLGLFGMARPQHVA